MTPEETIRNLINRSGPRQGTGRILTERSPGWFEVDVSTAKNQQISSYVDPEKIKQKAKEEYREKDKAELDRARAEQNRAIQSQIKYEEPPPTAPTTSVIKHEGPPVPPAPPGQAQDTNVQTPKTSAPETPEQKAASDKEETESSIPNPRGAGGGLQTGSSLNTSNLQATQQRFTRGALNNSYDPNETRKNFIRESVIFSLNETNLRKSQRWQRKAKRTLEKIEKERDLLKTKINALSTTPAGRVASYPLRLDRAELTPAVDAAVAELSRASARVKRAKASGETRKDAREEDAAVRDAERRAERAWER